MSDDARCLCGSRIFFQKPTVITTASGSIRDIPSVFVLECVRCARAFYADSEAGKKTLRPYVPGVYAETELFKQALASWRNKDKPESNDSHIVLEDADKADFARLGIE